MIELAAKKIIVVVVLVALFFCGSASAAQKLDDERLTVLANFLATVDREDIGSMFVVHANDQSTEVFVSSLHDVNIAADALLFTLASQRGGADVRVTLGNTDIEVSGEELAVLAFTSGHARRSNQIVDQESQLVLGGSGVNDVLAVTNTFSSLGISGQQNVASNVLQNHDLNQRDTQRRLSFYGAQSEATFVASASNSLMRSLNLQPPIISNLDTFQLATSGVRNSTQFNNLATHFSQNPSELSDEDRQVWLNEISLLDIQGFVEEKGRQILLTFPRNCDGGTNVFGSVTKVHCDADVSYVFGSLAPNAIFAGLQSQIDNMVSRGTLSSLDGQAVLSTLANQLDRYAKSHSQQLPSFTPIATNIHTNFVEPPDRATVLESCNQVAAGILMTPVDRLSLSDTANNNLNAFCERLFDTRRIDMENATRLRLSGSPDFMVAIQRSEFNRLGIPTGGNFAYNSNVLSTGAIAQSINIGAPVSSLSRGVAGNASGLPNPHGGAGIDVNFLGELQPWLEEDFDISLRPLWDDLSVQFLFRMIGYPIVFVYENMLRGTATERVGEITAQRNNSPGGTPIRIAFQIVAWLAVCLYLLLMVVTAFVTINDLSKSGQLVSEQINASLMPVRSAAGAIGLMPIPAVGGMTVITLVLLAIGLMSFGIASSVSSFYYKTVLSEPVMVPEMTPDRALMSNIVTAAACSMILAETGEPENGWLTSMFRSGRKEGKDYFYLTNSEINYSGGQFFSGSNAHGTQGANSFGGDGKLRTRLAVSHILRAQESHNHVPRERAQRATNSIEGDQLRWWPSNYIREMQARHAPETSGRNRVTNFLNRDADITGGNVVNTDLRRIQFAREGWCGELFVAKAFAQGQDDIDELVRRVTQSDSDENMNTSALSINNSGADREVLRQVRTEQMRQWRNTLRQETYAAADRRIVELFQEVSETDSANIWDIACVLSFQSSIEKFNIDNQCKGRAFEPGGILHRDNISSEVLLSEVDRISDDFWNRVSNDILNIINSNRNPADKDTLVVLQQWGWIGLPFSFWIMEARNQEYESFYNMAKLFSMNMPAEPGGTANSLARINNRIRGIGLPFEPSSNQVADGTFQALFLNAQSRSEYHTSDTTTRELRDMMTLATSTDPQGPRSNTIITRASMGMGDSFVKVIGDTENVNASPMMSIRNTGNVLVMTSLTANVIAGTLSRMSQAVLDTPGVGAIPKVSAPLGALVTLLSQLMKWTEFVMYIGFFLSNVVPILPMVIYFMAVIGVFVYIVEAALGVNFGWAMKAHHKGDDWAGASIPVYRVALSVFLKAVLLVVGFIVGTSLHWVGYNLINTLFMPAATFANYAQGSANLLAVVGVLLTWTILQTVLAMKSYGLANELNNGVMRFIGTVDQRDLGEARDENRMAALINTSAQRAMMLGAVTSRRSRGSQPQGSSGEGDGEKDKGNTTSAASAKAGKAAPKP